MIFKISANNCMVHSTADLDKVAADIVKIFYDNTWDVFVPDPAPCCLWMGERINRNVMGFNIEHNPPSSSRIDDSVVIDS